MAGELRVDILGDKRIQANLQAAARKLDNPRPALEKAAKAVTRTAATLAPKRTGNLSRRNRARVTLRTASVFNRVRYAGYVENGTRAMRAHPYLRPALKQTDIASAFEQLADDVADTI
ncbi:MAG: hypothetical protein AMXMBFR58_37530 [Phycisphaerae bacterium]